MTLYIELIFCSFLPVNDLVKESIRLITCLML